MQNINKWLFSSCFAAQIILSSTLSAEASQAPLAPFALITIPKSGSHMIIKALHFLTGGEAIWHTRFPSVFYVPPDDGFLYTHFCVSPELEEDYNDLPLMKKIIMIRDLRDVCISIVSQIRKAPWPGLTGEKRREFLGMSFDEQLLFVINYDYDVHEVAKHAPNALQVSVLKVATQAQKYSRDASNLVCRYENLVGPMGGGSLEAQLEEIQAIADFLGVEVTQSELDELSAKIYGNEVNVFGKTGFKNYSSTFQHGQVGRWQTLFKEEHKIAFKERLGTALVDLGYEQDNNW